MVHILTKTLQTANIYVGLIKLTRALNKMILPENQTDRRPIIYVGLTKTIHVLAKTRLPKEQTAKHICGLNQADSHPYEKKATKGPNRQTSKLRLKQDDSHPY